MSTLGSEWLLSQDIRTSVTDWPTALELTLKWPLGPWRLQASCYMPTSLMICICTYTWRMGSSNFSSLVEYRQCCSVKWNFMSITDLILLQESGKFYVNHNRLATFSLSYLLLKEFLLFPYESTDGILLLLTFELITSTWLHVFAPHIFFDTSSKTGASTFLIYQFCFMTDGTLEHS